MDTVEEERELVVFSVPSESGREREAMDRVADAVTDLPLRDGQTESIRTAVSEAVMNAIEHGNAERSDLAVDVRAVTAGDELRVRVTDRAVGGAVPEDPEEPDIEAKLRGEQSPRGWGLFLIENMVDELRVSDDGDSRTVELIVRLDGGDDG